MNIIKTSGNLGMKELYDLTKSPEIQKMTNVKGQDLEIESFAVYTDTNTKDGSEQCIVSIKTTDGETFATNSKTFAREFQDILAMCEEAGADLPKLISVSAMVSKAGREFITCVYKA